jgi:hypothetical protein
MGNFMHMIERKNEIYKEEPVLKKIGHDRYDDTWVYGTSSEKMFRIVKIDEPILNYK